MPFASVFTLHSVISVKGEMRRSQSDAAASPLPDKVRPGTRFPLPLLYHYRLTGGPADRRTGGPADRRTGWGVPGDGWRGDEAMRVRGGGG